MSESQKLIELAARCEAATGPDRELDLAIKLALDPDGDIARVVKDERGIHGKPGMAWDLYANAVLFEKCNERGECFFNGGYPLPEYTASLDAALTLVPEGWSCSVSSSETGQHAQAVLGRSYPTNKNVYQEGRTRPLVTCAAALRARAAIA